jgi:hypothetical protein
VFLALRSVDERTAPPPTREPANPRMIGFITVDRCSIRTGRRGTGRDRSCRAHDNIPVSARRHKESAVAIERPVSFELIVRGKRERLEPDAWSIGAAERQAFFQIEHVEPPTPALDHILNARQPAIVVIPVEVLVEGAAQHPLHLDPWRARAVRLDQQRGVVEPDLRMNVPVVRGRDQSAPIDCHKRGPAAIDRGVIIDRIEHRAIEIAIAPGSLPVEPVDLGSFVDGIAEKGTPLFVPRQPRRMNDQRAVRLPQPHFAAGRVQIHVVFADDAYSRFDGVDVAVGIDPAVPDCDPLTGS